MSAALKEWPLAASVVTTLLFLLLGQQWLADLSNPLWFALMLLWPLAAILVSGFALVRHAESVAAKVGEPSAHQRSARRRASANVPGLPDAAVREMMDTTQKSVVALMLLVLAGCDSEATRRQQIPVVLADQGEPVTLHIPRGYIEEPKKPQGVLPNVILRIKAQDFSEAAAFAPESEVRLLIEPTASKVDAAHKLQAAALLKHKSAEDAIAKSAELSKPGLIAYTYPNAKASDESKAYYLKSKSGDVFVECRRSVCKAYKTWKKQVHLRFDYQPVQTADVEQVDAAVDSMLQSFAPEAKTAR